MQTFVYSAEGLALTEDFEGLRLEAYQDVAGVWTIGYGHTGPGVGPGMTIVPREAEAMLNADLDDAVACVNEATLAKISQKQFDALVDFCFNVGRGNFLQSTLLKKLNRADYAGAAAEFGLWVHAGGKIAAGLVRRRAAEARLFGEGTTLGVR